MKAIYPGSFDPVTYGHLDIIRRVSGLADELIVAVLGNMSKKLLFSAEERAEMLRMCTKELSNVKIITFSGLLVNFAKQQGSNIIIRGLRAMTDFEYEFQMALSNRQLNGEVETFFIPASLKYLYLSSSIVKEIFQLGGDIDSMVPPEVKKMLAEKLKK